METLHIIHRRIIPYGTLYFIASENHPTQSIYPPTNSLQCDIRLRQHYYYAMIPCSGTLRLRRLDLSGSFLSHVDPVGEQIICSLQISKNWPDLIPWKSSFLFKYFLFISSCKCCQQTGEGQPGWYFHHRWTVDTHFATGTSVSQRTCCQLVLSKMH